MMTPEASITMRSSEEVNIGVVKDGGAKQIKRGGGKMYSHHKKVRTNFLQLTQSEGEKNYASFMNSVDECITRCGSPS